MIFILDYQKKNKFYFSNRSLTFIRQHQGSRLGGRLRDYIRTEIIILRKFYGLYPEIDQILLRKIVTKLIRIKKSKSARKLLNLKKIHLNREYLINFFIYIASFLGTNFYNFFHKTFLNWSKRLRR